MVLRERILIIVTIFVLFIGVIAFTSQAQIVTAQTGAPHIRTTDTFADLLQNLDERGDPFSIVLINYDAERLRELVVNYDTGFDVYEIGQDYVCVVEIQNRDIVPMGAVGSFCIPYSNISYIYIHAG